MKTFILAVATLATAVQSKPLVKMSDWEYFLDTVRPIYGYGMQVASGWMNGLVSIDPAQPLYCITNGIPLITA